MQPEEMAELPDFYDLLGIEDTATDKDIQKAFRRQAIKCHPDKNPSATAAAQFHALTVAVGLLSDPKERKEYDAVRAQKLAAKKRRDQVEGERRTWIDELERSERDHQSSSGLRKSRKSEREQREAELSKKGARLRAQLQARLRTKEGSTKQTDVSGTDPLRAAQLQNDMSHTKLRTLRIRYRGSPLTSAELAAIFGRYGTVVEVVSMNKETGNSALIEFETMQDAQAVMQRSTAAYRDIDLRTISWATGSAPIISSAPSNPQSHVTSSPSGGTDTRKFSFRAPAGQSGPKIEPPSRDEQYMDEYERSVLTRMRERQHQRQHQVPLQT